jgi:hypothetical protein
VTGWVLDQAYLSQFGDLLSHAEIAYTNNSDKELQNRATVKEKNATFAALKRFLSMYVNMLEGNPHIPDEAIESMGLRPRRQAAHQPNPAPTEAPVLSALTLHHYEVDIYVSTLQHAHPTHFVTDEKFGGFLLRYKFENDPEWKTLISTKLHYTLAFTEEEVGKHIILQAAWVNTRMQSGPWSGEIREIIN